jgi:uncharacterized phage protein (TIGR01671 family)
MREIKFRGKRIDNGEWIYGSLLDVDIIVSGPVDVDGDYIGLSEWSSVHPKTVGEYTGLKDKNGKEIYEGDILLNNYHDVPKIDVVEFKPPIFTYRNSFRWSLNEDEVIGNIYENPELITKE